MALWVAAGIMERVYVFKFRACIDERIFPKGFQQLWASKKFNYKQWFASGTQELEQSWRNNCSFFFILVESNSCQNHELSQIHTQVVEK